jgi:phosphoinositide-3-kinase regulatory subunit 4
LKDQKDPPVTEAMDVFSVGCVIAELFLDGKDTFTLSQLFNYRAHQLDIQVHLAAIEDDNIRVNSTYYLKRSAETDPAIPTISVVDSADDCPESGRATDIL